MERRIYPRVRRAFVPVCTALILACAVTLRAGEELPKEKKDAGPKVTLGVGVTYAWWNPVWGRISMAGDMIVFVLLNRYLKLETPSRTYSVDPCPLASLRLSVDFNPRWFLVARGEVGAFNNAWVGVRSMTTSLSGTFEYSAYMMRLTRYEGSMYAGVRIADYCSFFLGPEYMGYSIREKSSNAYVDNSIREQMNCLGFSAGFAFRAALPSGFSIDPSISGGFLYGFTTGRSGSTSTRYYPWSLGARFMVPVVYYIEKLRLRCQAGFRYQFLYYFRVSNPDYLERWDHVYGPEIAASYSF